MPELVEIRVSSKTNPQSLSGSIVAAFSDGHEVTLLAIGPFPTAQAYKAVCIANRTLASRGKLLCIIPGMEQRDIPNRNKPNVKEPWVVTTFRIRDYVNGRSP